MNHGTSDMSFESSNIFAHMIDAKEYWFRMECLVYKLGISPTDPTGAMRRILLAEFAHAVKKHTGIYNAYYMNGKAYDYHEF
jgi:hypothetical protein